MRIAALLAARVAALTLGLATPALSAVSVDHDAKTNFTTFKTYHWGSGTPAASDLHQKRIEAAVDRELKAKGLTRVEGDAPADLLVVTHVSKDKKTEIHVDDYKRAETYVSRNHWLFPDPFIPSATAMVNVFALSTHWMTGR